MAADRARRALTAGSVQGRGAREAARRAAARAKAAATSVRAATRDALAAVPPEARRELRASLRRFGRVRTPQQAAAAFETEIGVLLDVVTPVLVEHPLPVRRTGSAKAVVASGAALAATGEQLEAILAVFSRGAAVPATIPLALGAIFLSLALELYVAVSLRVHDLEEAGAPIDPPTIAAEAAWAMAGVAGRRGRAALTSTVVSRLTARMMSRWGRGIVPLAGVAYSSWDAQRTIAAISELGVPRPGASRPVIPPEG